MMERLLDVEVGRYGTIIEEIALSCCITGFGCRLLVEHKVYGLRRFMGCFGGIGPRSGAEDG